MSSILKSLKKLQTEEQDISLSLNGTMDPSAGSGGRLPTHWALLAGALVGGLLVLLVVSRGEKEAVVGNRSEAVPAPASVQVEPAPVVVTPDKSSSPKLSEEDSSLQGVEFLSVAQPTTQPESLSSSAQAKPKTVSPSAEILEPGGSASVTEVVMETESVPGLGEQVDTEPTEMVLPVLVDEIFYEEGSSANVAVVNGLPAMEGTLVDGVLVKKIHADSVTFDADGERVKVPLTPDSN